MSWKTHINARSWDKTEAGPLNHSSNLATVKQIKGPAPFIALEGFVEHLSQT